MMSTAQIALQQIRDKGYAQPYRNQGKAIHLIGIAFDPEKRNVGAVGDGVGLGVWFAVPTIVLAMHILYFIIFNQ